MLDTTSPCLPWTLSAPPSLSAAILTCLNSLALQENKAETRSTFGQGNFVRMIKFPYIWHIDVYTHIYPAGCRVGSYLPRARRSAVTYEVRPRARCTAVVVPLRLPAHPREAEQNSAAPPALLAHSHGQYTTTGGWQRKKMTRWMRLSMN